MEDDIKESSHDANEQECQVTYEEVEEGIRKRPDQEPDRAAFRIGLDMIRSWFIRPRPDSA